MRRLVDLAFAAAALWPPTSFFAFNQLSNLLAPFELFTHLFDRRRTAPLRELHVFETEVVGALGRQLEKVVAAHRQGQGQGRWAAPGVRSPDPGSVAWLMIMAGYRGI